MEVGQGPNWGCSANGKKKMKRNYKTCNFIRVNNCDEIMRIQLSVV
jgi:hypothetical protein